MDLNACKCFSCQCEEFPLIKFSCQHYICRRCCYIAIIKESKPIDEDTASLEIQAESKLNGFSISCLKCTIGKASAQTDDFTFKDIKNHSFPCEGCNSKPLEAMIYCFVCKTYLCPGCELIHDKILAFASHKKSADLLNARNSLQCSCDHEREIAFYCKVCGVYACLECCLTDHIEHRFQMVANVDISIGLDSGAEEPVSHDEEQLIGESALDRNLGSDRIGETTDTKPLVLKPYVHCKSKSLVLSSRSTGNEKFVRTGQARFSTLEFSPKSKHLSQDFIRNPTYIKSSILGVTKSKNLQTVESYTSTLELRKSHSTKKRYTPRSPTKATLFLEPSILEGDEDLRKQIEELSLLVQEETAKGTDLIRQILLRIDSALEGLKGLYSQGSDKEPIESSLTTISDALRTLHFYVANNKDLSSGRLDKLCITIASITERTKQKETQLNRTAVEQVLSSLERNKLKRPVRKSSFSFSMKTLDLSEIGNMLDLKEIRLFSSTLMTPDSMPYVIALIHTLENKLFVCYVNNFTNVIEVLEIGQEETCFKPMPTHEGKFPVFNVNKTSQRLNEQKDNPHGYVRFQLRGHRAAINFIRSFSMHGAHFLVSGSVDGTAKVWRLLDDDFSLFQNIEFRGFVDLTGFSKSGNSLTPRSVSQENLSRREKGSKGVKKTPRDRSRASLMTTEQYNVISSCVTSTLEPSTGKEVVLLALCSFGKTSNPIHLYNLRSAKALKEIQVQGKVSFLEMINFNAVYDKTNRIERLSSHKQGRFSGIFLFASVHHSHHELQAYDVVSCELLYRIRTESYVCSLTYSSKAKTNHLLFVDRFGTVRKAELLTGAVRLEAKVGCHGLCRWDDKRVICFGRNGFKVMETEGLSVLKDYRNVHGDSVMGILKGLHPLYGLCLFSYGEDKVLKCWRN